jgi:hypothetical protein
MKPVPLSVKVQWAFDFIQYMKFASRADCVFHKHYSSLYGITEPLDT